MSSHAWAFGSAQAKFLRHPAQQSPSDNGGEQFFACVQTFVQSTQRLKFPQSPMAIAVQRMT
jgi:hypothetical protein